MTLLQDFGDLMHETVTLERWLGPDEYGDGLYAAPVDAVARVEYEPRVTYGPDAKAVTSSATVILGALPAVSPSDRVTLPDGRVPVIIAIETIPDELGQTYYQAVLTA